MQLGAGDQHVEAVILHLAGPYAQQRFFHQRADGFQRGVRDVRHGHDEIADQDLGLLALLQRRGQGEGMHVHHLHAHVFQQRQQHGERLILACGIDFQAEVMLRRLILDVEVESGLPVGEHALDFLNIKQRGEGGVGVDVIFGEGLPVFTVNLLGLRIAVGVDQRIAQGVHPIIDDVGQFLT